MHLKICTMLASFFVLLFLIVADIPAAYTALSHSNMESTKNSEAKFYMDGVQRGYLKKLNDDKMLPFPVSKGGFQRQRKSENRKCYIVIEKTVTEMQEGQCIKLADNTPACHNEHYIAINNNDC
ncbi:unnamed protein product [Larinioides sclopetarius]|uniref:Uncharacterized protein n=1 Tax=Larinioides sclopetarius TaxID=280406 RepID=A0AAV2ALF9_9ARAC